LKFRNAQECHLSDTYSNICVGRMATEREKVCERARFAGIGKFATSRTVMTGNER